MWLLFACASALFAGLTAVLAKQGVRTTDSTLATALRTPVVPWGMTLLSGSIRELGQVDARSLAYLVLSGLATGASWLCYFKALQLGDVSRVAPVDKMSTVLTVIMAVLLLGEGLSALGAVGLVLVTIGTLLMLRAEDLRALPRALAGGGGWLLYALGAALFAALTAILGKIGIAAVPSDLATCASWLCYFRALQDGPASVVVPIDKLSVLVSVAFSVLVLREHVGVRALLGLAVLVAGTVALAL